MESDQKKQYLPSLLMIGIVILMTGAAELLQQEEIIFPEIAALAAGDLLAPCRTWNVNHFRMVVMIGIGAVIGICIVLFLPFPLWGQLLTAFVAGQLILLISGTGLAPVISACVLPVMLQSRSIVYPVSAVLMTLAVCGCRLLLERKHIRPKEAFVPERRLNKNEFAAAAIRTACYAAVLLPAIQLKLVLMTAPPLLVAFTEFSNPGGNPRKRPAASVVLVSVSAFAGAYLRILLSIKAGLPLTISAAVSAVALIFLFRRFSLYFPPSGAAMMLAMLISEEQLWFYPVEITVGCAIFLLLAQLFFPKRKKENQTPQRFL